MKHIFSLLLFCFALVSNAQDTFSIVAADPLTGEIGGAGASCLDDNNITGGVLIINDILPGRGAIHTQALWNPVNQLNAHNRMEEGMSPGQIIDWLFFNDVQGNPQVRQYGIVDLDTLGNPRAASFTGNNCQNYKNHITGPTYSIQGNILLGQQILDSMEARFLGTEGSLAEKLMAALQGANVPGADTRCMSEGVSSRSAFVRVARATDPEDNFYCDLAVTSTPYGVEPIDSLQVLFDEWLNYVGVEIMEPFVLKVRVYPNPVREESVLTMIGYELSEQFGIQFFDIYGRLISQKMIANGQTTLFREDFRTGLYFYRLTGNKGTVETGKFLVE
jgi:uncharacterized Ntn-hydrolase superfamily protein